MIHLNPFSNPSKISTCTNKFISKESFVKVTIKLPNTIVTIDKKIFHIHNLSNT